MGSKGKSTSTSNTTQSYTPDPTVAKAGRQAINMATTAANQPFNLPQQPVAGLNPDQLQAFQGIRDLYGTAQPYYDQARNQFQQSATPVSGQDVANFYNPMAGNVIAQMQNIFGQQQRNTTGQLTQAAGGVGADRIAVGQANLANQQGLAAGQTLSNLYQQALQSALQTKGLQQNAGYGFQGLGTTVQGANTQALSTLLGAGGLQQQQQQAELNSPYNLALQKFAYPFQTAQYLSGVVGQQAPVFKGTATGQSQTETTPAQPSLFSQIAGAGLTGLGLMGGFGGPSAIASGLGGAFGKGGGSDRSNPNNNYAAFGPTYFAARGGAVDLEDIGGSYAEGGDVFDDRFGAAFAPVPGSRPVTTLPVPGVPRLPGPAAAPSGSPFEGATGFDVTDMDTGQIVNAGSLNGAGPQTNPWAAIKPTNDAVPMRSPVPQAPQRALALDDTGMNASAAGAEGTGDVPLRQSDMTMPRDQLPYPDATKLDEGQKFARSPWMALTAAGLGIMGGTSPWAGVNIGKGGQEGIKALEQQREDARKEVTANQAAERLFQQAQQELNKYNRTTGDTEARLGLEREKMTMEQWFPTGAYTLDGYPILFNRKTGETKIAKEPGGTEAGTPGTSENPTDTSSQSVRKWIDENPDNPRAQAMMGDAERYLQTGTLPPNMGRGAQGAAEARRIRSLASELAKERNIPLADLPKRWQEFKGEQVAIQRFMSGPQGNTIRSLNVVVDHAETLGKLGEALKNGNVRVFNEIAQTWAKQTGAPAPTNFDMAKQIVGAELIKALGVAGAGTAEERASLGQAVSRASSPAQLVGVLDGVVRPLLGGQLRGIRQQFTTSTGLGEDKFNKMLFPNTIAFLEPKKQEDAKPQGKKQPSAEQQQAIDWLKDNANHPQAPAVRKRLQDSGVL